MVPGASGAGQVAGCPGAAASAAPLACPKQWLSSSGLWMADKQANFFGEGHCCPAASACLTKEEERASKGRAKPCSEQRLPCHQPCFKSISVRLCKDEAFAKLCDDSRVHNQQNAAERRQSAVRLPAQRSTVQASQELGLP